MLIAKFSPLTMTTVSRNELRDLLRSFKEALQFWLTSIKSQDQISAIKAAQVSDPLQELNKVTQLIKAHTTKVGIIFKPEVLEKETESSYNTLQKLSESVVLLVSLVAQLDPKDTSQIFFDEIVQCINEILLSNVHLATQLLILEQISDPYRDDSPQPTGELETTDGRLVSVGKVWSSCDSLIKILKDGKLGVLNHKFKQSIDLVEDGLDEFAEWAENPEEFDDEDPFGLSDSESDDEPNDTTPPTNEPNEPSEEQELAIQKLKEFSLKWLDKIKMVKLLLTSTSKSLPSVTSGETINIIYQAQKDVVNLIDKLIVELMMNGLTSSCDEYTSGITKNCNKLLRVVKEVNKSSDSKVKWCESWELKYKGS